MTKLTPNSISIERPAGQRVEIDKTTTGMYVIRDAYNGPYEYFKHRPLTAKDVATVKKNIVKIG